jgi:toxin CcdB
VAQFDLYRLAGESDLIVDCQSDLLRDLSTRFVLPLVISEKAEVLPGRLNPVLLIAGVRYRLITHLPAALPSTLLRRPGGVGG